MKKTFVINNTIIGVSEIVCRLPLVFTVGYLAKKIGTEAYGSWIVVLIYLGFMGTITSLGMSSTISRWIPICNPSKALGFLKLIFKTVFAALIIIFFLTLLFDDLIANIINLPHEFRNLLIFGSLFVAGNTADGLLDAYFKARILIVRQILLTLTRTVIEVLVIWLVFGTDLLFEQTAFFLLVNYIVGVFCCKLLLYPILLFWALDHSSEPITASERVDILRYGFTILPAALAMWFAAQGDRFVLSQIVEKNDLGIYAFGAALAANLYYFGYAVYPLLLPNLSQLFDKSDYQGIRSLFAESQRVLLYILIGALTILGVLSKEIILWTAGESYIDAKEVLLILGMAVATELLFGIYQYIFHLIKKPKIILWLNVGNTVVLLGVIYFTAYLGGITFVPWAVLIVTIVYNTVRYIYARRYLQISPGLYVVSFYITGLIWVFFASLLADVISGSLRLMLAITTALVVLVFLRREFVSSGR